VPLEELLDDLAALDLEGEEPVGWLDACCVNSFDNSLRGAGHVHRIACPPTSLPDPPPFRRVLCVQGAVRMWRRRRRRRQTARHGSHDGVRQWQRQQSWRQAERCSSPGAHHRPL
jgi:hypothetical protein